jgi:proteasome accessory factor C
VVELSFAGVDWLVREILKEAGDAAVLEPEDAREAVRAAVARLREANAAPAGV